MITTEDEAKTKWCPFDRHAAYSGAASGAGGGGVITPVVVNTHAVCAASGCMMWRRVDRKAQTGYCGLAGKPAGLVV